MVNEVHTRLDGEAHASFQHTSSAKGVEARGIHTNNSLVKSNTLHDTQYMYILSDSLISSSLYKKCTGLEFQHSLSCRGLEVPTFP